jgi:Tol biopolymer transport system component
VTKVDLTQGEINHYWPSLLPDGRHVLYTTTRLEKSGRRATPIVYAVSLGSNARREIARLNSRVVFTREGRVLFVHEGTLLAQTFDVGNLRLTGEPVRIADGVDYYRSTGAAAFSVSDAGTLVYSGPGQATALAWFDRRGRETGAVGTPQMFGHLRLSPDGSRVAADVVDLRLGTSDIWVYDLSRAVVTRLTTDLNGERMPTWSPDGQRIAFVSDRGVGSDASGDFFVKRSDGMGDEAELFVQVGPQFLEDWSRDGHIAYRDQSRETGDDIFILPPDGDRKPRPFLRTRFEEWGARFSPDSAWVAFVSNESGANEVYLAPFRGSGERTRVSTGGGISPRWRADGKELYFLSSDARTVMAVPVVLAPALKTGTPAPLFAIGGALGYMGRVRNIAYDVTPDGQRFLFGLAAGGQTPPQVSVMLNWTALLRP